MESLKPTVIVVSHAIRNRTKLRILAASPLQWQLGINRLDCFGNSACVYVKEVNETTYIPKGNIPSCVVVMNDAISLSNDCIHKVFGLGKFGNSL